MGKARKLAPLRAEARAVVVAVARNRSTGVGKIMVHVCELVITSCYSALSNLPEMCSAMLYSRAVVQLVGCARVYVHEGYERRGDGGNIFQRPHENRPIELSIVVRDLSISDKA